MVSKSDADDSSMADTVVSALSYIPTGIKASTICKTSQNGATKLVKGKTTTTDNSSQTNDQKKRRFFSSSCNNEVLFELDMSILPVTTDKDTTVAGDRKVLLL